MATQSTNITRDYYANMPEWQRQQLMGDAAFESEFRDAMSSVANRAADSPRAIAGMSEGERRGLGTINNATETATERMNRLQSGLGGIGVAQDLGNIRNPNAMERGQGPGEFRDIQNPTRQFNTIDAPEAAQLGDIDAFTDRYRSQYTGDVVDTTLAGMQRQADRERLARESRSAAIGGTSNTRTAVGNAVAEQLNNMNMGQTEAELRDRAFNTAAGLGLERGQLDLSRADMQNQFGLDTAQFMAGQESERRQYGLDLADFGLAEEQARSGFNLDRAQYGLADRTARAENQLQLAGFSLEEAIAQAQQGNVAAQTELEKAGMSRDMINDVLAARTAQGTARTEFGRSQRDIQQERNDAAYYGPMEAGKWLTDVYAGSRTRDSAPYSFEGTENTETESDSSSGWQQALAGAAAGLGAFL